MNKDKGDFMIRRLENKDLEQTAKIWLDTNREAHDFIPGSYWENHYLVVKEMLLQAEVYVYEAEQEIRGFVGLDDTYIAGIFVRSKDQSLGIGTQLLNFVKERKEELSLRVYQKNENAIRFYQREAFQVQEEGIDEDTKEKEYLMIWRKQNG